MKYLLSFLFLFIFWLQPTFSQGIVVRENADVTAMVERHIEINRQTYNIDGWRIQIFSTTDRNKLEAARTSFIGRYPYIPVDWEHASPWYRLRAGAFATKLEATKMLNLLKFDYPEAYLAKAPVRPMELLPAKM